MTGRQTILGAGAAILIGMAAMASAADARGVVAGGPHAGTSRGGGCAYALHKWQATGSHYWRKRYHACVDRD
jgi:hypothetical protein